MEYSVKELINIQMFQELMEEFYKISNIPFGLIDIDGNVLAGAGWQDICIKFHRANPFSAEKCKKSDASVAQRLKESKDYVIYQCEHGLVEGCVPIILEGEHIANLFCGQFFFEELDEEQLNKYRSKAKFYGYNEEEYIRAIKNTPIISREKIETNMRYFVNLAKMLSSIGLTQLKQRETEKLLIKTNIRLKRLDKMKTDFFANLSHEIKTPINLIFSVIQLLEKKINNSNLDNDDFEIKKKILILKQNCYRILRLINNLIDITRLDSGHFDLQMQNGNIVKVIEDITLSVAEYIEGKKIDLIFDTDVEEKHMCFDPNAIERILLNLLSNAARFVEKNGKIIVSINDMNEYVRIRVKDTGMGIKKNKLNLIFQRFKQVKTDLIKKNEGSGIGLSLVKSFVDLHKGKIYVESEYGKGTEFIIELPCNNEETVVNKIKESENMHHIEVISVEFSDIY